MERMYGVVPGNFAAGLSCNIVPLIRGIAVMNSTGKRITPQLQMRNIPWFKIFLAKRTQERT